MARKMDYNENSTTKMKPTYSFEEMRDLIRKADSQQDIKVIAFLLRIEGKRYDLHHIHALTRSFILVRAKIILR
jgi:hypothetical protein